MRKLFLAAVATLSILGGATSAIAGPVVSSPTGVLPPALTPPASALFGSNLTSGSGTFDDTFTFTVLGGPAYFTGQVSAIAAADGSQNVDFTQLALDGVITTSSSGGGVFVKTSSDPNPETWAVPLWAPVYLTPGDHTIELWGNLSGSVGSYSGTLNVTPAVPEPATWAMMLLGFGAMGFAVRRRGKPALAQVA